jgi:pimeloyl-ACP methyl ester carboxylesterase
MIRPSRKAFAISALVCAWFLLGGCVERAFAGANRTGSPRTGSEFAPHSFARAYLVRGILGLVFSRGMNRLAERLDEAGVHADVYDFPACDEIADTAIREYGEAPAPIALIGHSMGGRCVLLMARRLQEAKIPVGLLVTVDPVHGSPSVPANVERYINIFLSDSLLGGGDVMAEQGFQGHFASFDLASHWDVSHISIDKLDALHDQLIAKCVELATTPAKPEGEAIPLRYVVPPDAPVELWDSGIAVSARAGDTLQTLAATHRVPIWSITQVNPGLEGQPLIVGERVILPRHLLAMSAVSRQTRVRNEKANGVASKR